MVNLSAHKKGLEAGAPLEFVLLKDKRVFIDLVSKLYKHMLIKLS